MTTDRIRTAIPPALLAALVLAAVGDSATALYQAHVDGIADFEAARGKWEAVSLASTTSWFTITLLVALGFGELAGRLRGSARALVIVATVVAAVALFRPMVSIYLGYVHDSHSKSVRTYFLWSSRVSFVLWLIAAGCLAALLVRRGAVGIAIAIALIVTTAIDHPLRTISQWLLFDYDRAHTWHNAALTIVYQWAYVAALGAAVFTIGRDAGGVPEDRGHAVTGLERVGSALVARVVIAMGAAAFTMMAIGAKSPGLAKLLLTVVPLALLASAIAQVTGLFAAARDGAGPRVRLVAAAALSIWSLVATSCQAVAAFRVGRDRWSRGSMESWDRERLTDAATALPYLVPLVALAGSLLLLWAVHAIRARRPVHDGATPSQAAIWLVVGTLAGLMLQRYATRHVHDAGEFVLLTLLVATANIIAVLAVARACHKTAWALRSSEPEGLPPARVVDRNPM